MYCSKCGKKNDTDATFCRYCGEKINSEDEKNNLQNNVFPVNNFVKDEFRKYKKPLIVGIFAFAIIIYFFGFRCKAGFCLLPSSFHGDYCFIHTCDRSNCYNKVAEGEKYCYTHMPSHSTNYNYTPEVAKDVLVFSEVNISNNSSYTVCNATITNNGKKTYTFVEVKGKFEDSSGKIIDTDWTYAVGSEGLAPGESTSFRLSVDKDYDIKKCDFEILDYDKK